MSFTTASYWRTKYNQTKTTLDAAFELELKVTENPRASYEFDSGDGRIVARFWTLDQVNRLIDNLTTRLKRIEQRLCGTSIVFFRSRR